jgi:hypothetical protein
LRIKLENSTVYVDVVESFNSASACTGDAQRAEWNVAIAACPSRITADSMVMALKLVGTMVTLKPGLSICKPQMACQIFQVKCLICCWMLVCGRLSPFTDLRSLPTRQVRLYTFSVSRNIER